MQALPDGKESAEMVSDVKSDKSPSFFRPRGRTKKREKSSMQRGFETFVYFNGNPLEKFIPFMPKTNTTVQIDEIEKEGLLKNTATILKYGDNFENTFGILDDVVMGGKSLSKASVEKDDDGSYIRFEGFTDTNGGGFCSVRTKNFSKPLQLSEFKGLTLRVRSLKNFNYKFVIRDDENWDSIAW